jgi:hypothetical protein
MFFCWAMGGYLVVFGFGGEGAREMGILGLCQYPIPTRCLGWGHLERKCPFPTLSPHFPMDFQREPPVF